tara:strand:- start:3501 stop:4253 length:753 start_codon:yes stop_codon:yes gene_type:complete
MLNENVAMEDDSFGRNFTFHRVSSVVMPDYDYGLQPVNQYNRIRYVPTRMTPGPCNVLFHDTKDNQFQTMMKAYAGHYFGHPETGAHDMDPVNFSGYEMLNSKFAAGDAHHFGAKTIPSNARFFFEEIRIHNKDTAQGGRTTVLYNCMISQVSHSTFDYSQSSVSTYSVQFTPEHVNIGVVDGALINSKQAQRQSLESTTASTVANRIGTLDTSTQIIQQAYVGQNYGPNQSLRNQNGNTFVVSDQLPQE